MFKISVFILLFIFLSYTSEAEIMTLFYDDGTPEEFVMVPGEICEFDGSYTQYAVNFYNQLSKPIKLLKAEVWMTPGEENPSHSPGKFFFFVDALTYKDMSPGIAFKTIEWSCDSIGWKEIPIGGNVQIFPGKGFSLGVGWIPDEPLWFLGADKTPDISKKSWSFEDGLYCGWFNCLDMDVMIRAVVSVLTPLPPKFSYQGFMADPNWGPVVDGNYDVTFRLYDTATGGNPQWTENHPSVPVTKGMFRVMIGSSTPEGFLNIPFDKQQWLGISIG